MAALIEYVCTAPHDRRAEASVTLEQGSWAYCSSGASDGHRWTRIDPTAVEALRSVAGATRSRLISDENADPAAPAAAPLGARRNVAGSTARNKLRGVKHPRSLR